MSIYSKWSIFNLSYRFFKGLANLESRKLNRFLLRFSANLHSFSYHLISIFGAKLENGLHPKHRIMKYYDWFTANTSPEDKILDVGTGKGKLAFEIAKKVKHVTAVEIRNNKVDFARNHFQRKNLEFIHADFFEFNTDKSFDVCILSNILEHIEKRKELLNRVKIISRKLLVRVPDIYRSWTVPYKNEIGVEWRSDHTHVIEYTNESIKEELASVGWIIKSIENRWGEIYIIAERNNEKSYH